MLAWLRKLLRRKPKTYVVIYDELDEAGDPKTEEYYGYFASPAEARELWSSFSNGNDKLGNVKLCQVVESWESNR